MSPRAAWRLEGLGFTQVYDYVDGISDWLAAGMPSEGTSVGPRGSRAGDVARRDTPTCALDERLGAVAERAKEAGFDACVVINEERVVLGLLRAAELAKDPSLRIEQAMRPGPSTYRPNVPIAELVKVMADTDRPCFPITTLDGRLVGLLRLEDALQALVDTGEV
ncbi:MAG: CBS domain-containing protein [Actinomycetota bacterium]